MQLTKHKRFYVYVYVYKLKRNYAYAHAHAPDIKHTLLHVYMCKYRCVR